MLSPHDTEVLVHQRREELLQAAEQIRRGRRSNAHTRSRARLAVRRLAATRARWITRA